MKGASALIWPLVVIVGLVLLFFKKAGGAVSIEAQPSNNSKGFWGSAAGAAGGALVGVAASEVFDRIRQGNSASETPRQSQDIAPATITEMVAAPGPTIPPPPKYDGGGAGVLDFVPPWMKGGGVPVIEAKSVPVVPVAPVPLVPTVEQNSSSVSTVPGVVADAAERVAVKTTMPSIKERLEASKTASQEKREALIASSKNRASELFKVPTKSDSTPVPFVAPTVVKTMPVNKSGVTQSA